MKARTIPHYLETLYQSLDLGESARLRIVEEVRDHLTEARDAAVAVGVDPKDAEEAALRAFGDPVVLAASFRPGPWRSFLRWWRGRRWSIDLWHARHPVACALLTVTPLLVLLLLAQSWFVWLLPIYTAQQLWLALQTAGRPEIGYAARERGFWAEHPKLHHVYILLSTLPVAIYLVFGRYQLPSRFPWNVLLIPAALLLSWLFYSPRVRPAKPPIAVDD